MHHKHLPRRQDGYTDTYMQWKDLYASHAGSSQSWISYGNRRDKLSGVSSSYGSKLPQRNNHTYRNDVEHKKNHLSKICQNKVCNKSKMGGKISKMYAKVADKLEYNRGKAREARHEKAVRERSKHPSSFKRATKYRRMSMSNVSICLENGQLDSRKLVTWDILQIYHLYCESWHVVKKFDKIQSLLQLFNQRKRMCREYVR